MNKLHSHRYPGSGVVLDCIDSLTYFDIQCFTETHLGANILSDAIILTDKFDVPYRKERTNHGEELLIYFIS